MIGEGEWVNATPEDMAKLKAKWDAAHPGEELETLDREFTNWIRNGVTNLLNSNTTFADKEQAIADQNIANKQRIADLRKSDSGYTSTIQFQTDDKGNIIMKENFEKKPDLTGGIDIGPNLVTMDNVVESGNFRELIGLKIGKGVSLNVRQVEGEGNEHLWQLGQQGITGTTWNTSEKTLLNANKKREAKIILFQIMSREGHPWQDYLHTVIGGADGPWEPNMYDLEEEVKEEEEIVNVTADNQNIRIDVEKDKNRIEVLETIKERTQAENQELAKLNADIGGKIDKLGRIDAVVDDNKLMLNDARKVWDNINWSGGYSTAMKKAIDLISNISFNKETEFKTGRERGKNEIFNNKRLIDNIINNPEGNTFADIDNADIIAKANEYTKYGEFSKSITLPSTQPGFPGQKTLPIETEKSKYARILLALIELLPPPPTEE